MESSMDNDIRLYECPCGSFVDLNYQNASADHFFSCKEFKRVNSDELCQIDSILRKKINRDGLLITKIIFNRISAN